MKTAVAKKSPVSIVNPEVTKRFVFFKENYIKQTQQEISEKTGLAQSTISSIISGSRGMGFNVVRIFAREYGLNAKWLATGDPKEHPISKRQTETGGLMAKTLKELSAEVIELKTTIREMEQGILIMEKNQEAFLKRMEHLIEVMQRK